MKTFCLSWFLMWPAIAAADPTGVWNMTCRTPDGYTHESTLNLQADGTKLSGKIVSKRGTIEIADGKIEGSSISFNVVRKGNGDELKLEYLGTVEGKTMKLRMQYRDHDPVRLQGVRQ